MPIIPGSLTEGATITVTGTPSGDCFRILNHGGYLYTGYWNFGGNAMVAKTDLSTFTVSSVLTVSVVDGRVCDMVISGDYLYVVVSDAPALLVKVALSTFTVADTITMSFIPFVTTGQSKEMTTNDIDLFLLDYGGDWHIVNIASFTETAYTQMFEGGSGDKCPHTYCIGNYLYWVGGSALKRATISPLAFDTSLALGQRGNNLARLGDYFYTVEDQVWLSVICKVDIASFTKVDEVQISTNKIRDITVADGYLFMCSYEGKVIIVDPDSMTEEFSLSLSAATDHLQGIIPGSLYVTGFLLTNKITKLSYSLLSSPINKAYALSREEL